ncbi:MAG TPA: chromosome segregation protein SMC [Gammaproteobacteria bacterium]|nr:chromosome segregation protein SMC [Gammaproteobacteria bacterium]
MRLKTIKLAGFKSFVDPTAVTLNSNLTAIVGPNGCGKSNIVDAIRWVIGESSAKQLRGGLMTDVIFNGTAHRKPVGQAAIELLFDNSQGGLGGAYAQYSEISIRREITREGQSQFYLNSSRCRRRDILDVFLGTGLGPDSYAIIEQGVVSQLIEGKPEDIRIYLEEAAGISKYRERRRETENRIRSTRENLERLTDLRLEMEKQLEHLKRQANAAERYKNLKQEQRLVKGQLHALHAKTLNEKIVGHQLLLAQKTTELEGKIADHRRIEREIEQHRELQSAANESFNSVQGRFYQLGADIASQEQRINHIKERERQLASDLAQMETAWQEAEQNLSDDAENIENLSQEITTLEPLSKEAAALAEHVQQQLQEAEQQRTTWQQTWDSFQTESSQAEQKAQLEKTRLTHLTQKSQDIGQQIQRLAQQQQQLDFGQLPAEIDTLATQSTQLKQQLDLDQEQAAELNAQIQQLRETIQQTQTERDTQRQELQKLQQRQASLDALQQAALGKADQGVSEWLNQQGWAEKPRLLEGLQVDNGWETAVETVLAPYLEAVCTDNPQDLTLAANSPVAGRLAVYHTTSGLEKSSPISASSPQFVPLASKIASDLPLATLLHGIYAVESTTQALELTSALKPGESIVTRDGVWFGPCWVRISRAQDESTGILQRKQALQEIHTSITSYQEQLQTIENQLTHIQTTLKQYEEKRDNQQREFRENSREYSELHAQLSAKNTHLEQLRQRQAAITHELDQQQQLLEQTQEQLAEIQELAETAQLAQQQFAARREHLLKSRDSHNTTCQELRQRAQTAKQNADEQQVRLSSCQNQLHYLQQNIVRAQKQLTQLEQRRDELLARQEDIQLPLPELQEGLQNLLHERSVVEKELQTARHQVSQLEQQLRDIEQQRTATENAAQSLRDALAQIRIEQSTTQAHLENHLEQIQQAEFTLEQLLQELPEEAETTAWQQNLEQIENRIQRLGAINLAAIEEYSTVLERKTYLDNQDKDLCEALATLEEAIRKIDRESRSRLRETFERANENFQNLYQSMFPGGNAQLELTGEEVLDAGVLIRAQPPGKRNTMLHMLSGGEKALTAIALVFALFQLNPAPFCVLDEVDAPLDEANVGRFCRLVQSMANQVQFIYISHNKVAMEMAQQLVGVTMQEPGVSRLVTVDIDQAMAMAE